MFTITSYPLDQQAMPLWTIAMNPKSDVAALNYDAIFNPHFGLKKSILHFDISFFSPNLNLGNILNMFSFAVFSLNIL